MRSRTFLPTRLALAIALTVALVVALAGCMPAASAPAAAPVQASTSTDAHAGHADPAAEAIKAELTQRFGMTFASAGPHHVLGKAPNGVQLDLVGIPVVQVVLSLPGNDPAAVSGAAEPYLPYLPRLLGTSGPQSIGRDLLLESLASWSAGTSLDRQRSAEGTVARVTYTPDPPYVVLSVHR